MSAIPKTALERILELIGSVNREIELAEKIGSGFALKQARHLKSKYLEELDQELHKFGLSLADLSK